MSAKYFEAIVHIAADAVVSVDDSQRIVLFNHGAEVIFGYRADEILGQHLGVLLPEPARNAHRAMMQQFAVSAVTARLASDRRSVRGRRKNGELFPAEASISHVQIDGRTYFTAVLRDITERLQLEAKRQALLEHEREARAQAERASARAALLARASALLDASLDPGETLNALTHVCVSELGSLCIIDTLKDDGLARHVSVGREATDHADIAEAFMQYPKELPSSFITRAALVDGRSVLVRHIGEGDLSELAQDDQHLDLWRRVSPTSYMCVPLRANGRITGAIALVSGDQRQPYDAADLALLEEIATRASLALENARLYHAARRATALRDDVLAIVSHDLQNPLATISMALSRLDDEPEPSAQRRAELLRIASGSTAWMQRMIQDLLDVASIDAGHLSVEMANTDLVIVLVQAGELFKQQFADHGIAFVLDLPEHLPRVRVDQERILQLLGNLLTNAGKFTARGGTVTLSARQDEHNVVVAVRDTGRGIPQGDLPHLFDRFWQARRGAKARSTGLGLSIAKGIIDAHGGRIWVDTVEGVGSVFSFSVPLPDQPLGAHRAL